MCSAETGLQSPRAQPWRSEAKGFWWGPAWCRRISLQTIEPSGPGLPRDPSSPRPAWLRHQAPWLTLARGRQVGGFGPTDPTEGQRGQRQVHQGVVTAEATAACPLQHLVHHLGGKRRRWTWVSHPGSMCTTCQTSPHQPGVPRAAGVKRPFQSMPRGVREVGASPTAPFPSAHFLGHAPCCHRKRRR